MKDCCSKTINKRDKRCKRKSDGKVFKLPRNTQRKNCRNPRGFSQVASCAPYKDCYKRKRGGSRTKKGKLPELRKIKNNYGYKLNDPYSKRKKAIDRSIEGEAQKTGRTIRKAAISKKGRFNVLRIYRKNKRYDECMRLTKDMRYMDKKYKLGKTKNICNKSKSKPKNK
ncbi:MAG: hypothetical protein CME61_09800 [Halobacteriovoraceae bacterium]|nr:hypothetical protein [Halobacteriovoraceae bacterium]